MQTHRARNSRAIEQLGTFDPMPNKHDEKLVALNFDRLKFWIAHGAELTQPVGKLLGMYYTAVCYELQPAPAKVFNCKNMEYNFVPFLIPQITCEHPFY